VRPGVILRRRALLPQSWIATVHQSTFLFAAYELVWSGRRRSATPGATAAPSARGQASYATGTGLGPAGRAR
jgi:hypothetical protein